MLERDESEGEGEGEGGIVPMMFHVRSPPKTEGKLTSLMSGPSFCHVRRMAIYRRF